MTHTMGQKSGHAILAKDDVTLHPTGQESGHMQWLLLV